MGDQVGAAVEGTLYFVPLDEFERVLSLDAPKTDLAAIFANMARLNTLYMIARAGSGHIGSSFSSMDIVSWLLLDELKVENENNAGDIYFSSKGHDAPGYYAALIGAGRMNFDLIHKLRRIDGLPGHPDIHTECMETNTGSLGMGVSKAKGMVTANRILKRNGRVFVMTGDGELQEGQFWESLISAANHNFNEITVIIDHNKLQSDNFLSQVSDLGDLEAKLTAFGWHVERIDGHDIPAFSSVLENLKQVTDKPKIIIADTIKGKGVSFMEHTAMESDAEMYRFHSGAPDANSYTLATQEIINTINEQLASLNVDGLALSSVERVSNDSFQKLDLQHLVAAYSRNLVKQAGQNQKIVALDSDLILDTGLISFKELYPDRFVECGIAEQDMVSQAGGMAIKGLLPIAHSFACFLSARPNEQIYNNATEGTKVIYVGALAGVVPGGPGHSHQSVRDISALGGVPGLTLVEPCTELEVEQVVDWCVNTNISSSYIRLVSLPWPVPFSLPDDYKLEEGKGVALTEGTDAVLISYGPVMLTEAYKAAEMLSNIGISLKVVNLPWLNKVDGNWLAEIVQGVKVLFTLDNHYLVGGQGDIIAATLMESVGVGAIALRKLGIQDVPKCGTNDEVLMAHGLDAESLSKFIEKELKSV